MGHRRVRTSGTIATRLISLLPRRVVSDVPSRLTLLGISPVTKSPVIRYLIFYVIFTLFMLASQWLVGGPHAPAQQNSAATQPTSNVSPQSPLRSTGQ